MIKYTALFVDDEIVITESVNGIASSKGDAILLLTNSYTSKIYDLEQCIKDKENDILYLKTLIPELLFEQRKIENRKKYV